LIKTDNDKKDEEKPKDMNWTTGLQGYRPSRGVELLEGEERRNGEAKAFFPS
jgi:hypothetical protein